MREWLRLLADRGVDPLKLEQELPESGVSLRTLIARTRNSWHWRIKANMTSHTKSKRRCRAVWPVKLVRPSAPSKLMCRSFALVSCSSITPVIYVRCATTSSLRSRSCRTADGTRAKTFNFFINQPLMRKLSEKHIGMVDLPLRYSLATTTNGGASLGKHDAGTA
ncbi:hypothetical protein ACLB1R_08340 [Escherichia coli]